MKSFRGIIFLLLSAVIISCFLGCSDRGNINDNPPIAVPAAGDMLI